MSISSSVAAGKTLTSYDEFPYESYPFPVTHPSRLAAATGLFGLRPPDVTRCRVLELGCAAGGNLLPMAEQLPGARFLGVDLSAVQVQQGREVIEALGLSNVELRHASIQDIDSSYGPFDYIICHGVFSWVPQEVQDRILDIAATRLAPEGVAYVSYNTYPGWFMRGMIREMMRYHAANFATPKIQTRQARALLDFLAASVPQDGGPFAALLKQELEILRTQSDSYLYHEHLEEYNQPLFFHQFVQRAQAHGLQYLCEARVATMVPSTFSPEVERTLRLLAPEQVQAEQYLDFLRNRMFRETLLCRPTGQVSWTPRPETLLHYHLASRPVPTTGNVALDTQDPVTYRTPGGMTVTTTQPILKAALQALGGRWPQAVAFEQLLADSRQCLRRPTDTEEEDRRVLAQSLLKVYLISDLLELYTEPPRLVTHVGERPVASPLARYQVGRTSAITNRRHETVKLGPFHFILVPLLDGTRDRSALLDGLWQAATSGQLTVHQGSERVVDPEQLRRLLDSILDECLQQIGRLGLLIS